MSNPENSKFSYISDANGRLTATSTIDLFETTKVERINSWEKNTFSVE
jgi:hypothetical protein